MGHINFVQVCALWILLPKPSGEKFKTFIGESTAQSPDLSVSKPHTFASPWKCASNVSITVCPSLVTTGKNTSSVIFSCDMLQPSREFSGTSCHLIRVNRYQSNAQGESIAKHTFSFGETGAKAEGPHSDRTDVVGSTERFWVKLNGLTCADAAFTYTCSYQTMHGNFIKTYNFNIDLVAMRGPPVLRVSPLETTYQLKDKVLLTCHLNVAMAREVISTWAVSVRLDFSNDLITWEKLVIMSCFVSSPDNVSSADHVEDCSLDMVCEQEVQMDTVVECFRAYRCAVENHVYTSTHLITSLKAGEGNCTQTTAAVSFINQPKVIVGLSVAVAIIVCSILLVLFVTFKPPPDREMFQTLPIEMLDRGSLGRGSLGRGSLGQGGMFPAIQNMRQRLSLQHANAMPSQSASWRSATDKMEESDVDTSEYSSAATSDHSSTYDSNYEN